MTSMKIQQFSTPRYQVQNKYVEVQHSNRWSSTIEILKNFNILIVLVRAIGT